MAKSKRSENDTDSSGTGGGIQFFRKEYKEDRQGRRLRLLSRLRAAGEQYRAAARDAAANAKGLSIEECCERNSIELMPIGLLKVA